MSAEDTEKKFTPILPYDSTFSDRLDMYDNTEYFNKRDETSLHQSEKETGNVIKHYTLNMKEEPVVIANERSNKH